MAAAAALGTPLPDPPKDGITSLQFWADSPLLLVSSWDEVRRSGAAGKAVVFVLCACCAFNCCCRLLGDATRPPAHFLQTARVYDATAATLQGTFAAGAPVLDATFENEGVIYTGGLDGSVKRWVGAVGGAS